MKLCLECKVEKDESCFAYRSKQTLKLRKQCKLCAKAAHDKWRNSNQEHVNAHRRNYNNLRSNDQDYNNLRLTYGVRWRINNPDKVLIKSKNEALSLKDSYVRNRLRLCKENCPQRLIDLKREQLLLLRLAFQLKQEITNQLEHENGN